MSRRHPQVARKFAGTLPITFRGWIWLGATATCLATWYAIGRALFG